MASAASAWPFFGSSGHVAMSRGSIYFSSWAHVSGGGVVDGSSELFMLSFSFQALSDYHLPLAL